MRGRYIIAIVAVAAVAGVASLVYANVKEDNPPEPEVASHTTTSPSPSISPVHVEPITNSEPGSESGSSLPETTPAKSTPEVSPADSPASVTESDSPGVSAGSGDCDFELHETYSDGEEVNIHHKCQTKNDNGAEVESEISIEASSDGESTVDISITNE